MTTTPSSLPIACSLTADAAQDRESRWRALLSRALISRTSSRDGLRIELRKLPGVRGELERLVIAEEECCPFMSMSIDTTDHEFLVLAVTAPEAAAPILEQIFAGTER
jgi:hypothetical protein